MLEDFLSTNRTGIAGEAVDFVIVEKNETEKPLKLDYGIIKGNKTYLLGKTNSTPSSRLNYGYLLEKAVLKATDMNLATCWIGAFDKEYFNGIQLENGVTIPGILVVGYAAKKSSLQDNLIRISIKAAKRKPWNQLFFDYETILPLEKERIPQYAEPLEMIRLAPSSGNTQPWRIFYSTATNEFHFYKRPTNKSYEAAGMHDVDMGIAMCHFELASAKNGLEGKWTVSTGNIKSFDGLQYISTWKCK